MRKTIFIAVDDPNIQYLLQRYSEESGFYAIGAPHPSDATVLLSQRADVALIILDADPPDAMDGTRNTIMAQAYAGRVPVVFYSSFDAPTGAQPEGVTGYLPRSVMYDDFVAELKRAGLSAGIAFRNRELP